MILIIIYLIVLYYIIKINYKKNYNKKVKFSNIIDYYDYNSEKSFYTNSWNGNYYLEKNNDTELKNIYPNNNLDINPKKKEENIINFNSINKNDKIKDVYDNLICNYKKYDKKKIINTESSIIKGGSNLSYYSPNTWIYENEDINNGGLIHNNLMAYDSMANTDTAIF
jgi:hypothetical protein